MMGQVAEAVKDRTLAAAARRLFAQQRAFNDAQIGQVLPVLVAGRGRKAGQAHGRSPYLQSVHFEDTTRRSATIAAVRIVAARR